MNKKTLTKLEFYKITELLMNEATTPGGQRKCRNLKPSTDLTKIESMQEETAAAFTRIVKKGHLSFSGCYPIEESMKRLEVGAALNLPSFCVSPRCLPQPEEPKPMDVMRPSKNLPTVWTVILICWNRYLFFLPRLTVVSSAKTRSVTMPAAH